MLYPQEDQILHPYSIYWDYIADPENFVSVYDYNFTEYYDKYLASFINHEENSIHLHTLIPLTFNMFIYWLLTTENINKATFPSPIGGQYKIEILLLPKGDIKLTIPKILFEIIDGRKRFTRINKEYNVELDISKETIYQQFNEIKNKFNILMHKISNLSIFTQQYILVPYPNLDHIGRIIKKYALNLRDTSYWTPKTKHIPTVIYKCDGKPIQYPNYNLNLMVINNELSNNIINLIKENDYTVNILKSFAIIIGKSHIEHDEVTLKINCKIAIYPINYYYQSKIGQDMDILMAYSGAWKETSGFRKWAKEKFHITANNNEKLAYKIRKHIIKSAILP